MQTDIVQFTKDLMVCLENVIFFYLVRQVWKLIPTVLSTSKLANPQLSGPLLHLRVYSGEI